MKNLIFGLFFLASTVSFANSRTSSTNDKSSLRVAIKLLSEVAARSDSFKVQPNSDLKSMIAEAALVHYSAESMEDFEQSWVGEDSSAWGADEMSWGTDTVDGAEGYVDMVLADTRESLSGEEGAEETFKSSSAKAKKVFQILRKFKNVKYGVGPVGAIQCGVTFAALLIIDTETGDVYEITMEGSGC